MSFRIGQGIDFHKLEEGRDLWLGGIKIPHTRGAVGHSDADVLLHAICDALLGCIGDGDIGVHFPNTDMAYKDADSKELLKVCYKKIRERGYWLVNIDSTLLLEEPKISPYVQEMQKTIANILHMSTEDISIKATTTEHLSFIGRGEGICATAIAMIQKY